MPRAGAVMPKRSLPASCCWLDGDTTMTMLPVTSSKRTDLGLIQEEPTGAQAAVARRIDRRIPRR